MKVSVVIPVYNEQDAIIECIESLQAQNYKDFDVVVVDDGGSDKTLEVLSDLRFKIKDLRILKQEHKGAGAARNLGAKEANGEILVFVDADMTFDKNFLKKLVEPIIGPPFQSFDDVNGTFSKEEFVANWDNPWARCWNINEGWEEKRRHPKNYPDHQPVFRAILKSEFEKVGGFTPGGYDDDWSLSKKLGYEAVNAPGAIFYHKNPSNLSEIFNHAKWVGKRKYKFGYLGDIVALIRSFFPISIFVGLVKGIRNKDLRFIVFKLVYDFGVFKGIIELITSGKKSK